MIETEAVEVNVTQEDIEKGVPGDSSCCPIALAFARAVPGAVNIEVDCFQVNYGLGEDCFVLSLPAKADRFIGDFDNKRCDVAPFNFAAVPQAKRCDDDDDDWLSFDDDDDDDWLSFDDDDDDDWLSFDDDDDYDLEAEEEVE